MNFGSAAAAALTTTSPTSWFDPQEELKHALQAVQDTEETLKTLTADHASIFVGVERRNQACAEKLSCLLQETDKVCQTVSDCMNVLNQMISGTTSQQQQNHQGDLTSTKSKPSSVITLDAFLEKHSFRRKTLLQYSHQLFEILELPQFMDACMKSHLYDEAVNIALFANTLETRHNNKNTTLTMNPILAHVIQDIRKRSQYVYSHLLTRLQGDLSLPQCLEIITCLRRLNSIQVEQDIVKYNSYNNNEMKSVKMLTVGEFSINKVNFMDLNYRWTF